MVTKWVSDSLTLKSLVSVPIGHVSPVGPVSPSSTSLHWEIVSVLKLLAINWFYPLWSDLSVPRLPRLPCPHPPLRILQLLELVILGMGTLRCNHCDHGEEKKKWIICHFEIKVCGSGETTVSRSIAQCQTMESPPGVKYNSELLQKSIQFTGGLGVFNMPNSYRYQYFPNKIINIDIPLTWNAWSATSCFVFETLLIIRSDLRGAETKKSLLCSIVY